MTKVLGGVSSDKNDCLAALNVTDWNVHKVRITSIIFMNIEISFLVKIGCSDSSFKFNVHNV